jgi:hypothetical protein
MGIYAEWGDLYPTSFRERMDEAKDAALIRNARITGRPLARVLDRPGPLIEWWSVEHVREVLKGPDGLPLSAARVKVLAANGRFGRCKRKKTGKGHAWLIPAHWQPDNTYRLRLERGRRGPKLAYLRSPAPDNDPVPF